MKTLIRILVLFVALGFSVKAIAQGTTLTVFTEKGENITVFVNGEQKNSVPGDVVTITGIHGPSIKIRVVFKDPSIREIEKSVFNTTSGQLFYVVRHGKKNDYILDKTSSDYIHTQAASEPAPAKVVEKESKPAVVKSETAAKNSAGGCVGPMSEGDFQASTVAISNAPFDGIKLSQAKKVVDAHCLLCRQIVELIYILNSEASRLTLAKEAYHHCYDPENYSDVKEALHSNKSKEDLQRYIDGSK